MMTFTEKHYYDFVADDIANTVRSNGATCGGGGEVLVIQRRFSDVIITETDVSPTLEAGAGGGGNNVPMIVEEDDMSYQEKTGTLNPGAHAGSYNGQDAYNDMLVTDNEKLRATGIRPVHGNGNGERLEDERLQGCDRPDQGGGKAT